MNQRQDAEDGLQDGLVSELYAGLESLQTPPGADAAILAAAKKEVGAGPRSLTGNSGRQRWFIPLSTAAGLLLAVGIVWKAEWLKPGQAPAPVTVALAPEVAPPVSAEPVPDTTLPATNSVPESVQLRPADSPAAASAEVPAVPRQKPDATLQLARKPQEKQPVMMEQSEVQVVGSMAVAPDAAAELSETERALEMAQAQLDQERREAVQSVAVAPPVAGAQTPAATREPLLPFPERFKQIRVGMERQQILSLLGRPRLHKPEWWEYHWMPQATAGAEPTVYRVYFDKQERLVRYEVTEGRQAPVSTVPAPR